MANDYTRVSDFGTQVGLSLLTLSVSVLLSLVEARCRRKRANPLTLRFRMMTRSTGSIKEGPSVILYSPTPLEVVTESCVALNKAFYIKRMKLRPNDANNKAELYFS
eukprot:Blabericola_migrator_1__4056@NODE_2235_length_3076_cov_13_810568_g1408_i0_p4_GENE_NODE_2235_length_3076_cov_13_810568_g1408_i0NODE_2235_length_3076_cov_13_810568_g1408_i0_p4_ORF_typecomplete_len107_score9_96_NODE_2235_length_3076_cov_13_810568_g1408_i023052625